MSRVRGHDAGAITAEFAAVLPAVVLVLALAVGALQLGSQRLRLQTAAAGAARLIGRGDPGASDVVSHTDPSARVTYATSGPLICATIEAPASLGILVGFTLTAAACALRDPES